MTAKEISDRVLARIDDSALPPGSVQADLSGGLVPPEVLAAINEGQELFSLLTLCLETSASLTLVANTTFATVRGTLPEFLCPLRLSIAGVRIRPATLNELDAQNEDWQNTPGGPARYFTKGFNFYGITPQPVNDTAADLIYARSPVQLVGDAFPEIPEAYHQSLVKYGIYKVKLKEGAQGLKRGLLEFNSFLDDAQAHGDFVRARSRAARYDTLPFELSLFDRARLMAALRAKPAA